MRRPEVGLPSPEGTTYESPTDTDLLSVPHLAEIKQNCANQIFAYRNCLEAAGSEDEEVVRVRCGEKLSALWDCTEAHMSKVKKV